MSKELIEYSERQTRILEDDISSLTRYTSKLRPFVLGMGSTLVEGSIQRTDISEHSSATRNAVSNLASIAINGKMSDPGLNGVRIATESIETTRNGRHETARKYSFRGTVEYF